MNLSEDAIQGLLHTGLGILANNTGHYGQFGPAVGKGGILGLQAMQQAKREREDDAFKERQLSMMEAYRKAQEEQLRAAAHEKMLEQQDFGGVPAAQAAQNQPSPIQSQFAQAQPKFPLDFGSVTASPPIARPMAKEMPIPQPTPLGNEMTAPPTNVEDSTNELSLANRMVEKWRNKLEEAKSTKGREYFSQLYRDAQRNYSDLLKADKTRQVHDIPISENQQQPFERNPNTGRWQPIEGSKPRPIFNPKPLVEQTIDMVGKGTQKYVEDFSKGIANEDLELRKAAANAPRLATRANDILSIVNSGKVITGSVADYRLAFAKAMGLAGLSDQETIANTENLFRDMSEATLGQIRASGLGAGQGFSNADREFLEKAAGGKISMDERTIRRIAVLTHKSAVESAKKWEERSMEMPEDALKATGIKRGQKIEMPPLIDPGTTTSESPVKVRKYNPATGKIE